MFRISVLTIFAMVVATSATAQAQTMGDCMRALSRAAQKAKAFGSNTDEARVSKDMLQAVADAARQRTWSPLQKEIVSSYMQFANAFDGERKAIAEEVQAGRKPKSALASATAKTAAFDAGVDAIDACGLSM